MNLQGEPPRKEDIFQKIQKLISEIFYKCVQCSELMYACALTGQLKTANTAFLSPYFRFARTPTYTHICTGCTLYNCIATILLTFRSILHQSACYAFFSSHNFQSLGVIDSGSRQMIFEFCSNLSEKRVKRNCNKNYINSMRF